ncbi:MAG: integration host factor subunit beta [Legionellales bacterium]|nr:integration host factor subunit beta [Legionellales bacterium]
MIKSELINILTNKQKHISEKDVSLSVNLLLEYLRETLGKGGRIEIRGFGSFCLHYRPPRNAHNPKTGNRVVTKAKHSPHFKPGKDLRERVNDSRHTYEIKDDEDYTGDEDSGSVSQSTSLIL